MDGDGWVSRLTGLVRAGGVLDLVPAGEVVDPGVADQWGEDRRIPAEVVREVLLWAARNPQQVDPKGLRVRGADVTGRVDLDNMNLPCQVEFEDCRIADGITLDSATMPNLFLNRSHIGTPNTHHDRAISAIGLYIKGQLVLSGATLTNPGGTALALDGASITGGVFLRRGFTADGEVLAVGATIGGTLGLTGATLTNPGGTALSMAKAHINGDVFARGFTAKGEVRANGATIGGVLTLSGAHLTNPEATTLNLENADVKIILLGETKDITGTVDLVSCRIDTLTCAWEGYPPGALAANGWQVRFVHGRVGTHAKTAQAWLDTRPADVPFSPQPGRELADMYDRTGHPEQARKMRHLAAQGIAKRAKGWSHLRLWSYNLVAGHGYYPHRVIGWLGLVFAIAIAVTATSPQLFEPAEYPKAAAAADTAALQTGIPAPPTLTGATPCPQLGTYPCFPRFTYALQTVVPPATVITTTAWQPATNTVLALFTILKAAGWILVVLFLATITGLLKRT